MESLTRLAGAGDLDRAAAVLGNAFADYPWTRWTVDASDHLQRITALQRIALEHFALPFGGVSVSLVDGRIESVAAWSNSSADETRRLDDTVVSEVAALEGNRHEASKDADRQVDLLRPTEPHLYLGVVGTNPAVHGQGLATRALAPLLETSSETGLDVWLETSSERNVAFYRRLGFDVAFHLTIDGGGPAVWGMSRPPDAN